MTVCPLVSVIMPTYNCGNYIAESIRSVQAQTLKEWELLIVDDCSDDNTEQVVQQFLDKDNRIFYQKLSKNSGPAVARTEALKKSKGRYIAFLDSDDLWFPQKLKSQIAFMQENEVDFSCTAYCQMDENGNSLSVALYPPEKTDYNKMLQLSNPIGNLTVMYNREKLGIYEVPNIKKRNDFALWLKILHDAPYCAGMQQVLASYRIRTNSVSSNKLAQAKYHWQLYRMVEKLSLFKSLWAITCWALVKGTGIGINKKRMI